MPDNELTDDKKEQIRKMKESLKAGKPINDPMGAAREARKEKISAMIASKEPTGDKEVTLEDENKNRENLVQTLNKTEPDETIQLGDDDADNTDKRTDDDGALRDKETDEEDAEDEDEETDEDAQEQIDLKKKKKDLHKKRDQLGKNIGRNREIENEVLQKTQSLLLQQAEEHRRWVHDQKEYQESIRLEQAAKKYSDDKALAEQAKLQLREQRHRAQQAANWAQVDQLVEYETQLQVYTNQLSNEQKNLLDYMAQKKAQNTQQPQQPSQQRKSVLGDPSRDAVAAEKMKAWVATKPWFALQDGKPANEETTKAIQEMDKLHKSHIPADQDIFYRELETKVEPPKKTTVQEPEKPKSKPVVTGGAEGGSGDITKIPTKINVSDLKPTYQEMYRNLKKTQGEKEAVKFLKDNFNPKMLRSN